MHQAKLFLLRSRKILKSILTLSRLKHIPLWLSFTREVLKTLRTKMFALLPAGPCTRYALRGLLFTSQDVTLRPKTNRPFKPPRSHQLKRGRKISTGKAPAPPYVYGGFLSRTHTVPLSIIKATLSTVSGTSIEVCVAPA